MSQPPLAPRRPSPRRHHGDTFVDHYAWMRDKSDPAFLAYLEAENAYTEAETAGLADLRQEIFEDISARTKQTDLSVPEFVRHRGLGDFWYYARSTEGHDYPSYHRCPAQGRDSLPHPQAGSPVGEQLLLDAQVLAADSAFFALGTFNVSPDGRLAAYSVDHSGDERYRLVFLDLTTGELLSDELPEVAAGGTWAGNDAFCYLTVDEAWRPEKVWRHRLGVTGPDELLFTESDERFWLGVDSSRDDRWLLVASASKTTTEAWLLDLVDPDAELRCVRPRVEGLEYDVEVASDRLFIVHNQDAPDFALAQAPLTAATGADWTPIWAGEPGVRLLGVTAYDRVLVASVRRDGLQLVTLRYRDANGDVGPETAIAFDEPLYQLDADDGDEADTDRIRLHYQSMVTPDQVIEYRLTDGARKVLRQRPVLDHPRFGAYDPSAYVQRREWATAPDGTRVPISLVHRADTPLDGAAGCLLYGYGAYEISIPPTFSIARLSLLDRGYVYAIAHVRGGGELGRAWYDGGRLAAKTNTFTDFIACARHLVAAGYTSADRLAAEGGSAGGLLIGAAINLAPDTFAAVHAAVPFVDALTTILDPELPLTVMEWEEWGDPLHDPDVYRRMRGYSPYENIRTGEYPAILVTASLNDTRVEITEPAKWVAELRHTSGSTRPIHLRTELTAGHGGNSGRYQGWRDAAFELAWLMAHTSQG
ncbi:MAG TPA: S9 family peptidase [Propionicimonas sp.]|nr:S9 family peptidase [Propionicimonas sp.]HQA76879.1 S9 family peptidase [Propionicimonas sp.]HQD97315.1 S9 family peptidase [Propionicimonas sp.]